MRPFVVFIAAGTASGAATQLAACSSHPCAALCETYEQRMREDFGVIGIDCNAEKWSQAGSCGDCVDKFVEESIYPVGTCTDEGKIYAAPFPVETPAGASCKEASCSNGIAIDFLDVDGKPLGHPVTGSWSYPGREGTFNCPKGGKQIICFGEDKLLLSFGQRLSTLAPLDIAIDVKTSTDSPVMFSYEGTFRPEYEIRQPAGSGCPPACAFARKEISLSP